MSTNHDGFVAVIRNPHTKELSFVTEISDLTTLRALNNFLRLIAGSGFKHESNMPEIPSEDGSAKRIVMTIDLTERTQKGVDALERAFVLALIKSGIAKNPMVCPIAPAIATKPEHLLRRH